MKAVKTTLMIATVMMVVGPALGDWSPNDGHKMHFPQYPDPFGWDVNGTSPIVLADDWVCSETGPVKDIHLWGSWLNGQPGTISNIHVSIHDNLPPDAAVSYSRPADPAIWERDFGPGDFVLKDPVGTGIQGWLEPGATTGDPDDHFRYHQINIIEIDDPFEQKKGRVYWLDISVKLQPDSTDPRWGWKTADVNSYPIGFQGTHFMDDAVYKVPGAAGWFPLFDPETGKSLDLAFVITPEPTSLGLLVLGGLSLLRRRRKTSRA